MISSKMSELIKELFRENQKLIDDEKTSKKERLRLIKINKKIIDLFD